LAPSDKSRTIRNTLTAVFQLILVSTSLFSNNSRQVIR
jgi:hypothetical protein